MRKSVFEFEDVRTFSPPMPMPPFWIEMCGVSNCNGTYRIDRHISNVNVIEYIISGTGTLNLDGKVYHPSAGDIYILPAGSNHSYFTGNEDPWTKIFFNLQGNAIPVF